jgi:hypothetical protein
MDGLITKHMLMQKTKMDFNSFFQYKEPIKHLPKELKQINEVKQYLIQNGLDPEDIDQYVV